MSGYGVYRDLTAIRVYNHVDALNETRRQVKVSGKPVATSVGVFFIAFAVVLAAVLLPGAKDSRSPFLYVCILGGLFVGIPAILGIAVVRENLRNKSIDARRTTNSR